MACFVLGRVWIQTMALRRSDSSPPQAVVWYSTTPLWTPTPSLWALSQAVHHPTYRPTSWNCTDWSLAIVKGRWVRCVCLNVEKTSFCTCWTLCCSLSICFCFFFVMNVSRVEFFSMMRTACINMNNDDNNKLKKRHTVRKHQFIYIIIYSKT